MKLTFEQFYAELQKNEPWFDQMKLRYFRKDLKDVANQCYIFLLASEQRWKAQDYQDFRKCYQSFLSKSPDKITAPQLQQVEVKKEEPEEPFLVGEERQKKISEWLEAVNKLPALKPTVKISHKELIENGDWKPKPAEPYPVTNESELRQRELHFQWVTQMFDARTGQPLPPDQFLSEDEWLKNQK